MRVYCEVLLLHIVVLSIVLESQVANGSPLSRSLANFMAIQNDANKTTESQAVKRNELLPINHEGWNRGWSHFHNRLRVPDFGYHDLHTSDEHGEKLELESHPRHYMHHGPHYLHEIHDHHHGGEYPHDHHEHYVYHEPMHHGPSMMHHGHYPMMHHHGHHFEHHDEEESGDHDEHHDYGDEVHGEGDWDVGGGYFQLEEHGSDVNVVALKKHGTKVHMSGGDFNVIRDPWRHHSLFAGLFHPHEMPGHGHLPMEQFHQHFTYIANDKAINHHTYEHNTHLEDNHDYHHNEEHRHGHDEGEGHHGHGREYRPGHHDDDDHDKREYFPSSSVSLAMQGQTKQEIAAKEIPDVITIPLHKISLSSAEAVRKTPSSSTEEFQRIVSPSVDGLRTVPSSSAEATSDENSNVFSENAVTRESKEDDQHSDDDHHKKELPKVEAPRLEPLNGIKIGPKSQGTIMEIPLSPIFKRQLAKSNKILRVPETDIALVTIMKRSSQTEQSKSDLERGRKLARAFLGKVFQQKSKRR